MPVCTTMTRNAERISAGYDLSNLRTDGFFPFTDSRILRAVPAAVGRRFFCGENQHVLSYVELPAENSASASLDAEKQDITARYLPITLKPVISAGFPKFSKICDSFFLIVTVMYRVSNIFWQIFSGDQTGDHTHVQQHQYPVCT